MNRSSASVWRNARANDPHGLPACPSSISEPAYASLCYAKYCMVSIYIACHGTLADIDLLSEL